MPQNEYMSSPQTSASVSHLISTPPPSQRLILASSSRYRAELLTRLGLEFSQKSPDLDETARTGESPSALATRLGRAKARVIAEQHPQAWVIGSDQVATLDDLQPIGKPGSYERAVTQLRQASGKTMRVYTSLSLQHLASGFDQTVMDLVTVQFRDLGEAQIHYYLKQEKPFDCAGSVKSEGLGGALLARVSNEDPSALIGLPLIKLVDLFKAANIDVLTDQHPFARQP
jgi:septum formation protein